MNSSYANSSIFFHNIVPSSYLDFRRDVEDTSDYYFIEVPTITDPSYLKIYDWEHFELTRWRMWMGKNWSISLVASFIYIVFIFSVQKLMKNREPFQLRAMLTCWNLLLAAFSILGFLRTAPELLYVLSNHGWFKSICIRDEHNIATAFWGLLMTFSKLVELGDTAFIVLRKQPLIFLHCKYHHVTVLVYTWRTYETYNPSLRFFMTMNMFIHGFMYLYYAIRSLKIKVPRQYAMMITFLQLSQMVMGVTINIYSIYVKAMGDECACSWDNIALAMIMYFTYMLLFANFFYKTYLNKPKRKVA